MDEKKQRKQIASLQAVPSPSHAYFDFPLYGLPRRLAILFWGEHSNGLSNQADVEQILHLSCSQAIVNWLNALDQSDFFIVSLMYDNKLWALSIRPKIPGNSGMGSEWNSHFPEFHSEILGVPREVGLKFRKIGIPGKFRSIRPFLLGPSFSKPGNRIQHGWSSSF